MAADHETPVAQRPRRALRATSIHQSDVSQLRPSRLSGPGCPCSGRPPQAEPGLPQAGSGSVDRDCRPVRDGLDGAAADSGRLRVPEFNLLDALTVEDYVPLPLRLSGQQPDRGPGAVAGRPDRSRPRCWSGGRPPRPAASSSGPSGRALATRSEVVFCDEAAGTLDSRTAAGVLGLLRAALDGSGATVVMITHDPVAASNVDRCSCWPTGGTSAAAGAAGPPQGHSTGPEGHRQSKVEPAYLAAEEYVYRQRVSRADDRAQCRWRSY